MPPTTDISILVAPTIQELQTKIATAIAQGWQVSGNMTFAGHQLPYRRNHHFYQTMVKTTALLAQINDKLGTISGNVSAIRTSAANTAASVDNIDKKTA